MTEKRAAGPELLDRPSRWDSSSLAVIALACAVILVKLAAALHESPIDMASPSGEAYTNIALVLAVLAPPLVCAAILNLWTGSLKAALLPVWLIVILEKFTSAVASREIEAVMSAALFLATVLAFVAAAHRGRIALSLGVLIVLAVAVIGARSAPALLQMPPMWDDLDTPAISVIEAISFAAEAFWSDGSFFLLVALFYAPVSWRIAHARGYAGSWLAMLLPFAALAVASTIHPTFRVLSLAAVVPIVVIPGHVWRGP